MKKYLITITISLFLNYSSFSQGISNIYNLLISYDLTTNENTFFTSEYDLSRLSPLDKYLAKPVKKKEHIEIKVDKFNNFSKTIVLLNSNQFEDWFVPEWKTVIDK